MNNNSLLHGLTLLVSVLTLSSCGTAPLSFALGVPVTRVDPELYAVKILSIDSSMQFTNPESPIPLSPGIRWITFEAAPGKSARGATQKTVAMKIEPCTRYYFAARRSSPMDSDWSLVVDLTEPVSGCNADEELRKAGNVAGASGTISAPDSKADSSH